MKISESCTGCGACYSVCPKTCISMKLDKLGELKPVIDSAHCINCNICRQTCPQQNPLELVYPKHCYAVWSKNAEDLVYSASGGFAAALYRYALENEIKAYGCDYFPNLECKHFQVTVPEDIKRVQSSKYSQSTAFVVFKDIKNNLYAGEKVVFIGTPCQVAGLKSFLRKDYRNLVTIDLVCHGTPPNKYLVEYLEKMFGKKKSISQIRFRGKYDQQLTVWEKDSIIYRKGYKDDLYFDSFYKNMISIETCYYCKYATRKRVSDITIGDFWGLGKLKSITALSSRPSLVLINSKPGEDLFNEIKNKFQFEERDVEEGIRGNGRLNSYPGKSELASTFRRLYPLFGFKKTVLLTTPLINKVRQLRIIKHKIVTFIWRYNK